MANLELSLIIPTYNEGDIILSTLNSIRQALGPELASRTEILVADDGTDDLPAKTSDFKSFDSVRVYRNEQRLGKGRSIASAIFKAEAPIVGFIDSDLSVDPARIVGAVKTIRNGADVVIGSRYGNRFEHDRSFMTSLAASVFSLISKAFLFGGGFVPHDTQCGFKFFKKGVATELYRDLHAKDGLADLEVLVRADRAGYAISEINVPRINVREGKRKLSSIFLSESASFARLIVMYGFGHARKTEAELATAKVRSD